MESTEFSISVTSEEYGFEDRELTFRYTEKDEEGQRAERYQVLDDLGVIFSGEKIWKTKEKDLFFGLVTVDREVYEDEVIRRSSYDYSTNRVSTEESSWDEFKEFLSGTDAEKYII